MLSGAAKNTRVYRAAGIAPAVLLSLCFFAAIFIFGDIPAYADKAEPAVSETDSSQAVLSQGDLPIGSEEYAESDLPVLLVTMRSELPIESDFSFSINAGATVYIDWGDGEITLCNAEPGQLSPVSGTLLGKEIKIYSAAEIENLVVTRMQLTYIDADVKSLDISGNLLDFSSLPLEDSIEGRYFYYPQTTVELSETVVSGRTVNIAKNAIAYDSRGVAHYTVYRWYDSSAAPVTPTISIDGRFAFGDNFIGKTLYCEMKNELFPKLTIKTKAILIVSSEAAVTQPSAPEESPDGEQSGKMKDSLIITIAIAANLLLMGAFATADKIRKRKT